MERYDATVMNANEHDKAFVKDFLSYIPVKIVPAAIGFLNIIILMKLLPPSSYGIYSVVLTLNLLMVQISTSWLGQAIFYVYPDYYLTQRNFFQGECLKLNLIAMIPIALIGFVVIINMYHSISLATIGIIGFVLLSFQSLIFALFQSSRNIVDQAIAAGGQSISQLALLYLLLFRNHGGELSALVAIVTSYGISLILLMIRGNASAFNPTINWSLPDREFTKKLLSFGGPMCIWFFANYFYTFGDRIILSQMTTSIAVGQYSAFRDLCTGMAGFLTMPLLMSSHPLFMAMKKTNCKRSEIENMIKLNISRVLMLFIPFFVIMKKFGFILINHYTKSSYTLSDLVMILIITSILLSSIAMYVHKGLEITGQTSTIARIAVMVALFSLAANIILGKLFTVIGVAIVGVASQILYISWVYYKVRDLIRPQIDLSTVLRLSIWFILVEVICKLLLLISVLSVEMNLLLQLTIILLATLTMYLVTPEFAFVKKLLHR